MQPASDSILLTLHRQEEDIYQDEVEDGIANCAEEQAQVWAQAALEEENSESKPFIQELLKMTQKFKAQKKEGETRSGALGCRTRVQPRYQKGKQQQFDQIVNKRIEADKRAVQLSDTQLTSRREAYQRMGSGPEEKEYTSSWEDSNFLCGANRVDNNEISSLVVEVDWPVQAGFAEDDSPRSVFLPLVGRPRHCGVMVGMGQKDTYVGDEAQCKRGILTLHVPVERGMVTNYEDYEKVLFHTFYNELRIDPEEHPVTLIESPGIGKQSREKICRILFETYQVPALSFLSRPVAAVTASGQVSGISIHFGHWNSWVVPVVDGNALVYASKQLEFGRRTITDYLMKILTERGYSFTTSCERDIVEDMQRKFAYVAKDFDEEMQQAATSSSLERSYELPDGQVITIGNERFRAPECLFQPAFLGLEELGLADAVCECLLVCDPTLRPVLLRNVVLSGDIFLGLIERLEGELQRRLPPKLPVQVVNPSNARYLSWVGGSICTTVGVHIVTRQMYEERGPEIVNQCFPFNGYWEDPRFVPVPLDKLEREHMISTPSIPTTKTETPTGVPSHSRTSPEEAASKDNTVVCTQEEANGNSMLIRVGKACAEAAEIFDEERVHRGYPSTCSTCQAIVHAQSKIHRDEDDNPAWTCDFCGQTTAFTSEPVVRDHYLLEGCAIPGDEPAPLTEVPASTVIFCIDVSSSMGSKVQGGNNRLHYIRQAVNNQIEYLRDQRPGTKVIILAFGSTVQVYYPVASVHQRVKTIQAIRATVAMGRELASSFHQPVEEVAEILQDINRLLRPSGATALGPCLSVAVGIASQCSQASIILFTDGEANVGEGSLQNISGLKFYPEIAAQAARNGTRIDVVTMEGEESGVAHLGQLADGTSGSVDIVDLKNIQDSLKACVSSQSIVTEIECLTILPRGLRFRAPYEPTHTASRYFGSLHEHSLISYSYEWTEEGLQEYRDKDALNMTTFDIEEASLRSLLIQNQISFTDKYGNRKCIVETLPMQVVGHKDRLENKLDASVVAVEAIHRAAALAQESKFKEARILLVSVQRLLQRQIRAPGAQKVYLAFITQAESLDGFMREAKQQAETETIQRGKHLDDDASKSIFQMKSLTLKSFFAGSE